MSDDQFILASASPRRRQLLEQLGLRFSIEPADIDESLAPGETGDVYVTRLSAEKARAVQKNNPDAVVLAADTTVVLGDRILGKPESKREGIEMLSGLSGSSHEVLTGVTVIRGDEIHTICISTMVKFRELQTSEMNYYWETGEPADKAGGYGLQGIGAVFVDSLDGSYSNVIGLPLAETVELLRSCGVACLGDIGNPDGSQEEFKVVQDSHHG